MKAPSIWWWNYHICRSFEVWNFNFIVSHLNATFPCGIPCISHNNEIKINAALERRFFLLFRNYLPHILGQVAGKVRHFQISISAPAQREAFWRRIAVSAARISQLNHMESCQLMRRSSSWLIFLIYCHRSFFCFKTSLDDIVLPMIYFFGLVLTRFFF